MEFLRVRELVFRANRALRMCGSKEFLPTILLSGRCCGVLWCFYSCPVLYVEFLLLGRSLGSSCGCGRRSLFLGGLVRVSCIRIGSFFLIFMRSGPSISSASLGPCSPSLIQSVGRVTCRSFLCTLRSLRFRSRMALYLLSGLPGRLSHFCICRAVRRQRRVVRYRVLLLSLRFLPAILRWGRGALLPGCCSVLILRSRTGVLTRSILRVVCKDSSSSRWIRCPGGTSPLPISRGYLLVLVSDRVRLSWSLLWFISRRICLLLPKFWGSRCG